MKYVKPLAFTSTLLVSLILANYDFFYKQFVWERQNRLELAATNGDVRAMRLWLFVGAKPNSMSLYCAASSDNPAAVKVLLDAGVDVNGTIKLGTTALHSAAAAGRTENVKLLIQRGADINALDDIGTPLDTALENRRMEAFCILYVAGAKTGSDLRARNEPIALW